MSSGHPKISSYIPGHFVGATSRLPFQAILASHSHSIMIVFYGTWFITSWIVQRLNLNYRKYQKMPDGQFTRHSYDIYLRMDRESDLSSSSFACLFFVFICMRLMELLKCFIDTLSSARALAGRFTFSKKFKQDENHLIPGDTETISFPLKYWCHVLPRHSGACVQPFIRFNTMLVILIPALMTLSCRLLIGYVLWHGTKMNVRPIRPMLYWKMGSSFSCVWHFLTIPSQFHL